MPTDDELRRAIDDAGLVGLPVLATEIGVPYDVLRRRRIRGDQTIEQPIVETTGPQWSRAQVERMKATVPRELPRGRPKKKTGETDD